MIEPIPFHLITRYLSNEATPAEQQVLFNWITSSKKNEQIFNEHVDIWKKVNEKGSFNLDKGLVKINSKIDAWENTQRKERNLTLPLVYKFAASFALLLVSASLILWFSKASPKEIVSLTQVKTEVGQHKSIKLNDSSTIQLNTFSQLTYPAKFASDKREVSLEGEAYFEIARDEERPFIIHTGAFTTRVLGTAFNIKNEKQRVIVSVSSGTVKVFNNKESAVLQHGDQAIYDLQTGKLILGKANLDYELAWLTRSLYLNDSPLSDVAEKIYDIYGYTSHFENLNIRTCRITGKFKQQPIENILEAIQFSTGIQYTLKNKTITWRGTGCEL
ncbi:MAG: FecR domain-containing protein [Flammeovirgaceae bacterium]|nr:FecR domain-containing protein [Flammeovirgaceae bacterium]